MTRLSTEYGKNDWLARCRYDHCHSIKIRCPMCKKPGHITTHVQKELGGVEICVQHSHFLENVDAGRNMYCEIASEVVNPVDIVKTWRLTADARKRLIDGYNKKLV